MLLTKGQITLR